MKKLFFTLSLILIYSNSVFAVEKIYLQRPTTYSNPIIRPTYNPYSSPYSYRKYNRNNPKRLQRLNKIRNLNRLKNNLYNWSSNPYSNGVMTGYSLPINNDIYKQMGISPMFTKQNTTSPTCNTNLFSSPIGNESYYNDGRFIRDLGGISSKTGVTIIYD